MRKIPVKGTSDYLPEEAELREYMQSSILNTYKTYGFERIMTPALEDIENLDNSDGGENLSLIFKILKRGEKLKNSMESKDRKELADLGLRYDLTLPLSRFYANNRQNLLSPFKCIQIEKAYRAEQPQKGRMRELVQCDIDIVGSDSLYCEVELIEATANALLNLGIEDFKIVINDRRILTGILLRCGFCEKEVPSVCVALDKLDKVGIVGVMEELDKKGLPRIAAAALSELLKAMPLQVCQLKKYCDATAPIEALEKIIEISRKRAYGKYTIELDVSLVRGQGYYTGTIFEIKSKAFNGSIGGGGRYDRLIGKFTGEDIPAVGFSIGFERIYWILRESNFLIPGKREKIAVLYNSVNFEQAAELAEDYRARYDVTMFEGPKKLGKLFSNLEKKGFKGVVIVENGGELRLIN